MKAILVVFAMGLFCSNTTAASSLPNYFNYTCDYQGTLTIQKSDLPTDAHVVDFEKTCSKLTDNSKTFVFTNCPKNKTFTVAMDKETNSDLVGGKSLKLYDVRCESAVIKPYLLSAIVAGFTVKPATATHYAVNMKGVTTPSMLKPADIKMSMEEHGSEVKTVEIGQELTIRINEPDGYRIKPVTCMAQGNSNNHTLWTENGNCEHDKELFGAKWTEGSGYVENTMYAFCFVGPSTRVDVSCTVRVCPQGYNGTLCDMGYCASGRRKREAEETGNLRLAKTETSLDVVNTLQPTSGAQGVLTNMAATLLLTSALIMKLIY